MSILRRLLGILVMIAGLIGLLISLAGLVGLYLVRPTATSAVNNIITTLSSSVTTSQKAMDATSQALSAGVTSVDALSEMLSSTATTVADTQPMMTKVNGLMGKTLPSTFTAASDSLVAAQDAAKSLEGAIQSFEMFRTVLAATPFISSMLPPSTETYNPEKSLAASLGDLAGNLDDMPATFDQMAKDIDKADDNLETIKTDLQTMSDNVALISDSLTQYLGMVGESKKSMENLTVLLASVQGQMGKIIDIAALVLALFFVWLFIAQVVIFSQGLELYHGTATRMEGSPPKPAAVEATKAE